MMSDERLRAEIEQGLDERLRMLIRDRLGGRDVVRSVRLVATEKEEDRLTLLIEVEIAPDADPTALADAYFGLTSKVRKAMGARLSDVFPVITPRFDQGAHA